MHLGEPAIRAGAAAALSAGRDVFLTADAPFRAAHASLLQQACGEPVLVFLPGDFYAPGVPRERCLRLDAAENASALFACAPSDGVFWADLRLTGSAAFAAALKAAGPRIWLLPFADAADPVQYGYRQSYENIAALRAEMKRPAALAALFAEPPDTDRAALFFGSGEWFSLCAAAQAVFPAVKTENEAERFSLVLRACEKRLMARTAVIFATRRQANAFYASFSGRCAAGLVHGGRAHAENARELGRFLRGETQVLCATKHLTVSSPFFTADRLVICGLPPCVSAWARIASLSAAPDRVLCFVSPEDRLLNARLAGAYAEALGFPALQFAARRLELEEALLARFDFSSP